MSTTSAVAAATKTVAGAATGASSSLSPTAGGGNATTQAMKAAAKLAAERNENLSHYLFIICGSLGFLLLVWTIVGSANRKIRHMVCLNTENQNYFSRAGTMSWFKKHIMYAPIMNKRHNREIQLSTAVNMGTLPTRLELVFLVLYFATNVIFCLLEIPYTSDTVTAFKSVRNRSGALAVTNMVPLFFMASRNNPLIVLMGLSFDSFNLLHRWFGRIVVIEVIVHTITHFVANTVSTPLSTAISTSFNVPFLRYGVIATIGMVFILIQAYSPIRHAFYETFKMLHILAAGTVVYGLWYHLKLKDFPQRPYLTTAVVVWACDRGLRVARILYNNLGSGGSRTIIEALPENAVRITVTLARPWNFKPGQHAYLYFPSITLLQSHPFSVAWSESVSDSSIDRLAMTKQDALAMNKTSVSFIVRARTGATMSIFKKASAAPEGRLSTRCLVEGPYGHLPSMASYGTAMIFAGGVGVTQAIPHVRELVIGYANGTVATRKVVLVWIIPNQDLLEWIRPFMTSILELEKRRDVLRIMIFVTRPRSAKEVHSPSSTVQMFPGKPNIETLISTEVDSQVGAMCVSVCGPGALSDEVRSATRSQQMRGEIDFAEEAFTW
ncbi:putative ferric reductase transmembrane component [Ceratocystis lukuohia]|uniref:ferric-chelate reductase (NADPH) n=3 Tax=Ceratocystis TaxID=5157 RepID=A0A0F8B0H2_CERFI|nr:putative ferric reductase transmembrane component [Ceratocystis platani]PHH50659.1 Ferric/cupric reductase transmembrane component 1 [Ceratocystis fimbriata CBS 114723]